MMRRGCIDRALDRRGDERGGRHGSGPALATRVNDRARCGVFRSALPLCCPRGLCVGPNRQPLNYGGPNHRFSFRSKVSGSQSPTTFLGMQKRWQPAFANPPVAVQAIE